ncbi:MAG TPA: molybdopterin-synthase adenylyltransferase MoeB [Myxococcota bacterium]|nr:molybdopterin-synthase adenylyltransferase MoeB [Myxococcota bacterium]
MTAPVLTPAQFERYRRHLNLPDFGLEGQRMLLDARVLLIGAGGLGCPLAQYLTAAGVGHIGLVDDDVVDTSNLQRQVLYGTADVGKPKVDVALARLRAMNPDVDAVGIRERITSQNALALMRDWDVIIDGTDNFPTRYLSNDACVLLGKPTVYGAILRFEGQASTFDAKRGPCYRCLFPEPPPPGAVPSCAEGGVLGILPGTIALIQATEAVKLITGIGEPLIGRFLHYDALAMRFSEFRFAKDPDCPVCGKNPTITELIDYDGFCGVTREVNPVAEISAAELQRALARGDELLLLDVREPHELEKARIAGSKLVPLGQLPARLAELADWKQRRVVAHCHKGGRSAKACAQLRDAGFANVANLSGGIEAWSITVDSSVPRY